MLMSVALVGVNNPCTDAGWGQRIGTSLIVFSVVCLVSYVAFYLYLKQQQAIEPDADGTEMKGGETQSNVSSQIKWLF